MYSITISSMRRTEAGDGGIESPNPNIMPRTVHSRKKNIIAGRKRAQQRLKTMERKVRDQHSPQRNSRTTASAYDAKSHTQTKHKVSNDLTCSARITGVSNPKQQGTAAINWAQYCRCPLHFGQSRAARTGK